MGSTRVTGGMYGSIVPYLNVSILAFCLYVVNLFVAIFYPTITLIAYEIYWGGPIVIWATAFVYLVVAFISWWARPRIRLGGSPKHWHRYQLINSIRRGEQTHFWSGTIVYCMLTIYWAIFIGFNAITSTTFPVTPLTALWTHRLAIYWASTVLSIGVIISSFFDHNARLHRFYALVNGSFKAIYTLTPGDMGLSPGSGALGGVIAPTYLQRRQVAPGPGEYV